MAMTNPPTFKRYVNWQKFPKNNPYDLRTKLLETLPYEIVLPSLQHIDLRDIDAFIQDEWSAYANERHFEAHYFFKLEADAVAFKLRWL